MHARRDVRANGKDERPRMATPAVEVAERSSGAAEGYQDVVLL